VQVIFDQRGVVVVVELQEQEWLMLVPIIVWSTLMK
jgi:hypothetical protein